MDDDPLAELKLELEALVAAKKEPLRVLAASPSVLKLQQVVQRSPTSDRADLAATAWVVIKDEVSGFSTEERGTLEALLGIHEDAVDLGPWERKSMAVDFYRPTSLEHMRKVVWRRLVAYLATELFNKSNALLMAEKARNLEDAVAKTIGGDSECPTRRMHKLKKRLEAARCQTNLLRSSLAGPGPDTGEHEHLILQLMWTWARLDIKRRALLHKWDRASVIPQLTRDRFVDHLSYVGRLFPLTAIDASWLRTLYRSDRYHELYVFSEKLRADDARYEGVRNQLISWASCPMLDLDQCDCELHAWMRTIDETLQILAEVTETNPSGSEAPSDEVTRESPIPRPCDTPTDPDSEPSPQAAGAEDP